MTNRICLLLPGWAALFSGVGGGWGTFAASYARYRSQVTLVCMPSAQQLSISRSLGASRVVFRVKDSTTEASLSKVSSGVEPGLFFHKISPLKKDRLRGRGISEAVS